MIPIFIGFDYVETVAYHVLAHSILKRASQPVSFCPVGNRTLPKDLWWRAPGEHDSTEFSNARFAVPLLADGWAIFMDCDMVCHGDITELWEQRDDRFAVMCVQHDYEPEKTTKFLGREQTRYRRKNWSSLMLVNCGHEAFQRRDWKEYINTINGLDLHQFAWLEDHEIGSIQGPWNVLLKEHAEKNANHLAHFTEGGPWHGILRYAEVIDWAEELEDLLHGENPCAEVYSHLNRGAVYAHAAYRSK